MSISIQTTPRRHLFDMEDHITRAEEAVEALMGFIDMENPHAYRAAVNCIADILKREIDGIQEHFSLAFEAAQNDDKPPLKAVEE